MKKILIILSMLCFGAYADTINIHWLNDDGTMYENTTCTVDGDLELPTPPTKTGYTFAGWELLPFTQIEYLESTGTQYIDTGFAPSSSCTFITKLTFTSDSHGQAYFGESNSATTDMVQMSNDHGYINVGYGAGNIRTGTKIVSNTTHEYRYYINTSGSFLEQDGVIINRSNSVAYGSDVDISLFALKYQNHHDLRALCKMYYFQIYCGDVLVHDFIPVLDKNGTPCMFDKVEKKFYYNAGSGDFIAGPVIGE